MGLENFGGGVISLNGETGLVTLTSVGNTILITTPTSSTINLETNIPGGLSFQGTWNALTNIPHLTSSVGTQGFYYIVSVAGTTNLNGITDWGVNDWAIFNGTVWQKLDNSDLVTSVNGQTGAVVLNMTNIAVGTALPFQVPTLNAAGTAWETNYYLNQNLRESDGPTFDGIRINNLASIQTLSVDGDATVTGTATFSTNVNLGNANNTIWFNQSNDLDGDVFTIAQFGSDPGSYITGTPGSFLWTGSSRTLSFVYTEGTAYNILAGNAQFNTVNVNNAVIAPSFNGGSFSGDGSGLSNVPASGISGGQALTRTNDTNVTVTLGGSPTTALLQAVSLTLGWSGQLSLARGGTNASLVASNGGIFYSTGSAGAILAGVASASRILLSGNSAAPTWSTPTHPTAATLNKAIYGDGTNWVLSTPAIPLNAAPGAGKILIGDGTNYVLSTPTYPNASVTAGKLIRSDGTNYAASTFTIPDTFVAFDMIYASAASVLAAVGANTTSTKKFLRMTGTGSAGQAPAWDTVTAADIPGAALTKADDTNVTLTLGGSPSTALLNAASITAGWTGQLGLTRGGTAASLTASNGGIVYSTSSAMAILSGTATAAQMLQSGASGAPAWSTTSWPATSTINQVLYSSSTNVIGGSANMTFNGSTFAITGAITATTNVILGTTGAAGAGILQIQGTAKTQIVLDSSGSDYGHISNPSANTWALAHGTNANTTLGTAVITWNASNNTTLGNSSSVSHNHTLTNGGFNFQTDSSSTYLQANLRPNSGKDGYLSFTESSVADRYYLAILHGDASLYLGIGGPGSPTNKWKWDASGHQIPITTNNVNIGDSSHYVSNAYITTLNGHTALFDTSLIIPIGSAPTMGTSGQICIDTTDIQFQTFYGAGEGLYVIAVPKKVLTFIIDVPTNADVRFVQVPYAMILTKVSATVIGATSVTFQIEKRTTAGTTGTNMLTSALVATTSGANTVAFASNAIASGQYLTYVSSSVSGSPSQISITIEYNITPT